MRRLSEDHKEYLRFQRTLWREQPHVSFGARAVYSYLLCFENYKSNIAEPCQERICRDLKMSLRPLRNFLRELEKVDLIRTERYTKKGKRRNRYILFAPRQQISAPESESAHIVPFPAQTSTNSIPETIRGSGLSA